MDLGATRSEGQLHEFSQIHEGLVGARSPQTLYHADAGNHPLPSDPREIEAVLIAASRCCEDHPYLLRRYGARGVAYIRSDDGYLATLVDHPQPYVDNQISWLARLLANRGMPRWLLETHLEILCVELSAAVPERAGHYARLQDAAQLLRTERQACIAPTDFDQQAAAFELASGAGLRNAGPLLVAAVCDEYGGLSEAVPSLVSWLGDDRRFSGRWCAALAESLVRVRRLASERRGRPQ
jgi:hypothetical protein